MPHPLPRQAFRFGETSVVTLEFDAEHTDHTVLALAARVPYLLSTLGQQASPQGDPLAGEDSDELLRLLGEITDLRAALRESTYRVLRRIDNRGVSLRQLGQAMNVSTDTAAYHLKQARAAREPEPAEDIVTVNGQTYRLPRELEQLRQDAPGLAGYLDG